MYIYISWKTNHEIIDELRLIYLYNNGISKVSKNSKQNNSETVRNENDKEIYL